MNKKKLTQKDKILIGVLSALIVIVIGAGAFFIIKNNNSADEQGAKAASSAVSASNGSSSTASSEASSDKTGTGKSSSKTGSGSASSASSDSSKSDGGKSSKTSSSSEKTSSKTSSKSKVKGDKVERVVPKENTSHASNKTLKVNGKTCYVGDTITIVLNITSQKSIVNYQGTASFDSKYLKVKDVKSNNFGVANFNGSDILYNASSLNGMNFSETGTVFTATFEVLKAGSTTVKNNLEIISELENNTIKQLSSTDYKVDIDVYK